MSDVHVLMLLSTTFSVAGCLSYVLASFIEKKCGLTWHVELLEYSALFNLIFGAVFGVSALIVCLVQS